MPRRRFRCTLPLVVLLILFAGAAAAQHHGGRSSPATAPPPPPPPPPAPPAPLVAISSGMGAIQFTAANYGVPAPQALTRQLRFDDDRVRGAALSALGVPPQYLQRGRIPYPHSTALEFAELGVTDEVDALLTVELDEHIVTAVLVPGEGNWRRVATLTFPTAYSDTSTTPDRWVRLARSLVQHERYRAVFRASVGSLRGGSYAENEAQLRVLNGHAEITISFESTARVCGTPAAATEPVATPRRASTSCAVTQRWLQPDPLDPWKRFELVSATGMLPAAEAGGPLMLNPIFESTHLRAFVCQPFVFAETAGHFEPTALPAPCRTR